MSDNKPIVRSYLEEVWTKRNWTAIDEHLAPDFVQHSSNVSSGRDGVQRFFAMIDAGFSDVNFSLDDLIADGDRVCWRFTLHARHTGPFAGLPATGKSITLTGMSIARLADGRMVEAWGEQEMLGLMQQLRG